MNWMYIIVQEDMNLIVVNTWVYLQYGQYILSLLFIYLYGIRFAYNLFGRVFLSTTITSLVLIIFMMVNHFKLILEENHSIRLISHRLVIWIPLYRWLWIISVLEYVPDNRWHCFDCACSYVYTKVYSSYKITYYYEDYFNMWIWVYVVWI